MAGFVRAGNRAGKQERSQPHPDIPPLDISVISQVHARVALFGTGGLVIAKSDPPDPDMRKNSPNWPKKLQVYNSGNFQAEFGVKNLKTSKSTAKVAKKTVRSAGNGTMMDWPSHHPDKPVKSSSHPATPRCVCPPHQWALGLGSKYGIRTTLERHEAQGTNCHRV
ncbi:hypothetical protein L218DRAFT_947112 [Marasmius fiardii PR-910]|nr:hypothetical protein L218DRAFT_947112 [Marasmius fiardii PR-910]